MNKAIAVWPVSCIEQSPIQKVCLLITMEMWGVKLSHILNMQVRQSPIFKIYIFFHRALFI